jgi:hypothetical protein
MQKILLAATAISAACGSPHRVSDSIEGVPAAHQQTISRAQLGFRWPLVPGTGTLACAEGGVILFRAAGVTYGVQGTPPGAADITPIRASEPSQPPSNPVRRLTQNVRMDAFAALKRCDATGADACSRGVRDRFRLSDEEARLIDAEDRERRWPPLVRGLMPLDPLVQTGRALCNQNRDSHP